MYYKFAHINFYCKMGKVVLPLVIFQSECATDLSYQK